MKTDSGEASERENTRPWLLRACSFFRTHLRFLSLQEAKLMEHVGLTEKLTIRREGNSMRQWKRRLRDWQRVSEDMAAKTGKARAEE